MPYSASQRYKPALQYKNGLQIDYSNYVLKKGWKKQNLQRMLLEPEKVKKNTGIQKLLKIKSKTTT